MIGLFAALAIASGVIIYRNVVQNPIKWWFKDTNESIQILI